MTFSEITKILDETNASFVLLLCHHNADPDALGSAFAFQKLLTKIKPNLTVEVGTGQSTSRLSKHILDYVPVKVNTQPDVEKANILVLLDTNTIQQLDELAERVAQSTAPLIVIDHHSANPETASKAELCIINEEASSTCEIVYSLYQDLNIKPDLDAAKALFLGIAFDTRHFVLGNSSTFKTVAELVDIGVNAQEALSKLTVPMDLSERIARIKASRRAKLLNIEDWIVAFSHVSAYQASAARALIDLGVHMAAVAGKKDNGDVEISMRCTREFNQKTGIHLGRDIAKPLGDYLQGTYLKGMGGGHAMAAGVNGKGDIEPALKHCLELLKEHMPNQQ